MINAKDLSPEDLSWFTRESAKHPEKQEELIWIQYKTKYSKGQIVINPKNLKKLGKARIKKIYKILHTIGQLVDHGNTSINTDFANQLISIATTKGRM